VTRYEDAVGNVRKVMSEHQTTTSVCHTLLLCVSKYALRTCKQHVCVSQHASVVECWAELCGMTLKASSHGLARAGLLQLLAVQHCTSCSKPTGKPNRIPCRIHDTGGQRSSH